MPLFSETEMPAQIVGMFKYSMASLKERLTGSSSGQLVCFGPETF